MALIWKRRRGDTLYEVRTAGRTRRLYTDGVFHSQYNHRRPLLGSVWDLLAVPAFFFPAGAIERVLVLGVGGGAVIKQLKRFVRPAQIVGIERDSMHLYVARRFFGVPLQGVDLHAADAVHWVKGYRGPGFDLIIDDLFGGVSGEPERAVAANTVWVRSLMRHLAPNGAVVTNFVSPKELRASAYHTHGPIRRRFASAFKLTTASTHNAVGVFLRRPSSARVLRENLAAFPALAPRGGRGGVQYRLQCLWQNGGANGL